MSSEVQRAEGIWNLDMNVIYCLGNYEASAILTLEVQIVITRLSISFVCVMKKTIHT